METSSASKKITIEQVVNNILDTIDREREREIISRRFGLFDRRETLEQIGELLGITRERVRQLEKAVIVRLKSKAEQDLPHIKEIEKIIIAELKDMGSVARVIDLSKRLNPENIKTGPAQVSFLSALSSKLIVIDENDSYYHAVGLKSVHDTKDAQAQILAIVDAIKNIGKPSKIDIIAQAVKDNDTTHVRSLASVSKQLATLNGTWGLLKWPTVNPKNIRDKIYVILQSNGSPLHFNEISQSIKDSSFKRKNVTTQAIHNELIKDKRFVLIGRGIYALKEWGYDKGTVADVITKVLKKSGEPLHRDEIVKRVLKSRQVKETTILLNLQGKSQFKRVAKATYSLAE